MYISATAASTFLGPLFAGFIVEYAGFAWVGWIDMLISFVFLVVIAFGMHETIFHRDKYSLAKKKRKRR